MHSCFTFQKAKWIWIKEKETDQYAEFYSEFDYFGGNARLYISSKTDYLVKINDCFVNCGQYSDFPELKSVDELPVTNFLVRGKNKIFILGRSIDQDSFTHIKDGHGIIFELRSDEDTILYSDERIFSRKSPVYESGEKYIISFQLSFGYVCNLRTTDILWTKQSEIVDCKSRFFLRPISKLDMTEINNSECIARGAYRLEKDGDDLESYQNAFLSRFSTTGKELVAAEKDDGVYFIVDLKKESSGFLSFDIEIEEDADITVAFGEHLKDLRVRYKIGSRNFVLFHKASKGRNAFTGYLRRIGCRYLQFFISSKRAKIYKATLLETLYPVKIKSNFIKDFLLNKIYDVSLNTLRQCMHEHYEDCPWREQSQYAGDSFLQILSGFYAFENQEFAKASLALMGHELNKEGFLAITSPSRCNGFKFLLRLQNFYG